jgi:shikimate kinase
MDRRIIIVGFMGSGKSTVAQALARRLNSAMIDLDREIARTYGRSPKQIIEQEGESVFRRIETEVLGRVLKDNNAQVVALGGGAWTVPTNRNLISEDGAISVWLDARFELCWQRIVDSGSERPLARNESQARALHEERLSYYSKANLHIDASENKSADQIADEVIQALQRCDIR